MSEGSPPRDPSTTPRRRAVTARHYGSGDLSLTLHGLEAGKAARIHLEHKSGAALIVPYCKSTGREQRLELSTTGFDGTNYRITIDDAAGTALIEASRPTVILGGASSVLLPRGEDLAPSSALRITGDEDTMPITVRKA